MTEKEDKSKNQVPHERADSHPCVSPSEKSDLSSRGPAFTIKEYTQYTESMMSAIPDPLFVMDGTFRIISANRSFYSTFHMEPADVEGKPFYEMGACRRDLSDLSKRFRNIILNHTTVDDLEVDYYFPHTGEKTLLLNAARIDWGHGKTPLILVAAKDITRRIQADLAVQKDQYKLHAMVYEYGMRYRSISLFNQMSEKLQSCNALEETYPTINQFARKLFPASAGALFLLNPSRNLFEAVTSWGKSLSGERSFKPDDCWAVRHGKIHTTGADPGLSCRHLPGTDGLTAWCIPLPAHRELLGILHLQQRSSAGSRHKNRDWDEYPGSMNDEMQLAVTLSGHLALVLANIKLRQSLQQQVVHDPLTDLFNRRFMEETLSREIHRAKRSGTSMGIIMIDLDHFRRFNNTYGHEAGDTVLKEIGSFLKSNIRQEDMACRYGGEEFTLILPGASLEVAQTRAEALRRMAPYLQIVHQGKLLESITLSIGVALYPDNGSTGRAVIQSADTALYRAKNEGRNRVVTADSSETGIPAQPATAGSELFLPYSPGR